MIEFLLAGTTPFPFARRAGTSTQHGCVSASLKDIPPEDAARYGKLHAWLPTGERVYFVWDGAKYRVAILD